MLLPLVLVLRVRVCRCRFQRILLLSAYAGAENPLGQAYACPVSRDMSTGKGEQGLVELSFGFQVGQVAVDQDNALAAADIVI
jgi:hypothetical protein